MVALRTGGQADRAGLRPDDVIVTITGAPPGPLTEKSFWQLVDHDGVYTLEVHRGAQRHRLTLTIKNVL